MHSLIKEGTSKFPNNNQKGVSLNHIISSVRTIIIQEIPKIKAVKFRH